MAYVTSLYIVSILHAEILHQDLWLPDERARLRTGRAFARRARLRAGRHESEADVILLNTCSVRDIADQKALGKMGMLGRLAKERPHMVFGFLGCMARARGASLMQDLAHVDLVVGTQKFHRVADYVDQLVKVNAKVADSRERPPGGMDDVRFSIVDVEEAGRSQATIRDHRLKERQATAFVSIMQGCNMHCTFFILPQTRGAERAGRSARSWRRSRFGFARGPRGDAARGHRESLRSP